MTKTGLNRNIDLRNYYSRKHLTKLVQKKRNYIFSFLLLYLCIAPGISFSQNVITFDDQGHTNNSDYGNPYTIVNNGETFKFTGSAGTHKYRNINPDGCPDPGVSYLVIEMASSNTWTIETISGNEINLGTIRFDNIYACYAFEYALTIEGFQNGLSTGPAQAFSTTGFNSIFTSNSNFDSVDKIVISCSDHINLGIDDINWEPAGPSCTDPSIPTVSTSPTSVCSGNSSTITISGNLNDATAWHIYTGSCGGTSIGNTSSSAFSVALTSATTYFIRGEGGCVTPGSCASVTVNITPPDNAGFSYSAASYCVDALDPTPTITGLAGGTFSSTTGLSISASSGTIDVSASTPGTYTVTYTTAGTCPNSSNTSITINALDDPSFNYSTAAYCMDALDPTPTITGLTGGTFSSTAGLSISAGLGTIDVSASTPGTYTVTYTTTGTCPNSSNTAVTINALDDPSFSYSAAAYCVDALDPTPTITGLAGGTFSSTAGLSINGTSGAIDVSASTPNTYTITYTTAGTCPNSSNASVTINSLDDASFNYSAAAYCADASDPTPTIIGLAGGTFSSTAGLSINGTSGAIDVSASTPNTYTVTYTTAGTCPNSSTALVIINSLDDASFNYSAAAYCANVSDPTPTITGLAGGTFFSTVGLILTAGSGAIDVSASTQGTYTVTYTTAGTCPNSSSTSVTVNQAYNFTETDYVCSGESYTFPDGTTQNNITAQVIHTSNLQTVGCICDSIIETTVNVITIDNTVTQNGITLSANEIDAEYQWLDCTDIYSLIAGETTQSFTTSSNGSYSVEITKNSCIDTSTCIVISSVGIKNNIENLFDVYPNPTNGKIIVDLDNEYENVIVNVLNATGQLILSEEFKTTKQLNLDIKGTSGIYFIEIVTEQKKSIIKIIKQ